MSVAIETFAFGRFTLHPSQVCFANSLSYVSVNLKPVVKNHLMVISRRSVARFLDLTPAEAADLMCTAQTTCGVLKSVMNPAPEAFTLALQDGQLAGQTVPHVHLHILPRFAGDFDRNDDVYDVLEGKDIKRSATDHGAAPDAEPWRIARTAEDMAAEASVLRSAFDEHLKNQEQ